MQKLPESAILLLKPYFPELRLEQVNIHEGIPWYVPMDAAAYTDGYDIYFKRNFYQPCTIEGLALLGHELTHTRQYQRRGKLKFRALYLGSSAAGVIAVSDPDFAREFYDKRDLATASPAHELNTFEEEARGMQKMIADDLTRDYGGKQHVLCGVVPAIHHVITIEVEKIRANPVRRRTKPPARRKKK